MASSRVVLETSEVEQGVRVLRNIATTLFQPGTTIGQSDLSTFSTVSGFRNVGLRLGRISDFYSPEALGALADRCCVSAQRR